jgi:hypothetical protein
VARLARRLTGQEFVDRYVSAVQALKVGDRTRLDTRGLEGYFLKQTVYVRYWEPADQRRTG